MKFNSVSKKNRVYLFCGAIVAAAVFLFIYVQNNNMKSATAPQSSGQFINTQVETTIKTKIPEKHILSDNSETTEFDFKTRKALEYSQQFNRLPTSQRIQAPSNLIAHPLLASTSWKIWPNTRVLNKDNLQASDNKLAGVSNLVIVEAVNENPDLSEFDSGSPVVVYDSRLKKAGIITGVLKIETSSRELLEKDLLVQRARITDSFEQINTYFVTSTDQIFNLEELYLNLKSASYIKNIELEILSKSYEKF